MVVELLCCFCPIKDSVFFFEFFCDCYFCFVLLLRGQNFVVKLFYRRIHDKRSLVAYDLHKLFVCHIRGDFYFFLQTNISCIKSQHSNHSCYACFFFAVINSTLYRVCTSVLRQQRGMKVYCSYLRDRKNFFRQKLSKGKCNKKVRL